jgi:hypothetical protein
MFHENQAAPLAKASIIKRFIDCFLIWLAAAKPGRRQVSLQPLYLHIRSHNSNLFKIRPPQKKLIHNKGVGQRMSHPLAKIMACKNEK